MRDDNLRDQVRAAVGRGLRSALKEGKSATVSALRTALNVLDNATAPRATEGSAVRTEVAARKVPRAEVEALLRAAADECSAAARDYERLGQPERAARLREEALVIEGCLRHLPPLPSGAS
jgi:hypothetical protein